MEASRPLSWGVGCWQTHVFDDLLGMVEVAERHGFDHFWYGNEKLHPDMWIGLAGAALNSRRLRIGTFIADPYSQHPALAAAAIATLDHYSGGRGVLVFGAGGSGLRELGISRTRPVATVEAAVTLVRSLLRGERVQCDGPIFVADAQLHFPARADLPIWIASRAPGMLELAGRIADGAMIGTIATPASILQALERIQAGATAARRSLSDVTVSVRVDVSVDDDPKVAREALRGFIAGILSASYPDRAFIEHVGVEVPAELEAICAAKDLRLAWQSGHLVPDELVDALAWAGTASEVAERVAAAIEVGVDNVTLMFHPQAGQPAEQLDRFARDVIPRVAALHGVAALGPKGKG
jgi:5,10-methylenetetrahydromethanopterin reductase